jgi:hypothetical protein
LIVPSNRQWIELLESLAICPARLFSADDFFDQVGGQKRQITAAADESWSDILALRDGSERIGPSGP